MNAGAYGRRQAAKYGIIFTSSSLSDGAASTLPAANIVVQTTSGSENAFIVSNSKTEQMKNA